MRGRRLVTAATTFAAAAAIVLPAAATHQAQTAGSVRSAVSLTGPSYGTYGSAVALTGKLWRYGTSTVVSGHPVVLQRSVHGRNVWGTMTGKRTTTSSTGTFSFIVTLSESYDYRAVYAGSATYTSAVSGKVSPAVKHLVEFDSIRTTNRGHGDGGGTVTVAGRAFPVLPKGAVVYLQRYSSSSRSWATVGRAAATGSIGFSVHAWIAGSVATYRLHVPVRAPYYAGISRGVQFAHYTWRGAFRKAVLASGGYRAPWYDIYSTTRYPRKQVAYAGAAVGGTSWLEINTAGCLTMHLVGENYTDSYDPTRVRTGALDGTRWIRYVDLEPGTYRTMASIPIGGMPRVRLQVMDLGRTGEPLSDFYTWVLCSN